MTATTEALKMARDALADLIGACKQAKVDLTVGIRDGDPVHPVSAALTWPLATAINTIAAIDALPSTPSGEPADLLGEARYAIESLLKKIRKDAPGLSGKLMGYAEAVAVRIAEAQAAPTAQALLPADLLAYMLREFKAERARLDGFIALGNEVKRADRYDRWIAALSGAAPLLSNGPTPSETAGTASVAGLQLMSASDLLKAWQDAACVRFVSRSSGQRTTDTVSRDDLIQLINAARDTSAAPQAAHTAAAELARPMTERDQFDMAMWHARLGELADAYYEAGRTNPARQRARADLMLHALECATGWRTRSALAAHTAAAQAGPVPATGNLLLLLDDYIGTRKGGASSAEIERAEAALGLAIMAAEAAHTAAAGLADHVPAGTEAEAATDAKLGLVMLPPIRVDRATHAALQQAAKARGVILPAIVRERLAPYTISTAAHTAAPEPVATPRDEWPTDATGASGHLAGLAFGAAPAEEIGHCVGLLRDLIEAQAAAPQAQAVRALTDAEIDEAAQAIDCDQAFLAGFERGARWSESNCAAAWGLTLAAPSQQGE